MFRWELPSKAAIMKWKDYKAIQSTKPRPRLARLNMPDVIHYHSYSSFLVVCCLFDNLYSDVSVPAFVDFTVSHSNAAVFS